MFCCASQLALLNIPKDLCSEVSVQRPGELRGQRHASRLVLRIQEPVLRERRRGPGPRQLLGLASPKGLPPLNRDPDTSVSCHLLCSGAGSLMVAWASGVWSGEMPVAIRMQVNQMKQKCLLKMAETKFGCFLL